MKKALIGSGGFATEVKSQMGDMTILSFVDDIYYKGEKYTLPLSKFDPNKYEIAIAIGDPIIRKQIVSKLPKETKYFTFIHESVMIFDNVIIGEGSIICPGVIITTNCKLGNHTHLNLNTTIGHDNILGDYFTTAPGVNISGNNIIGNCVYFGTNSVTKQKINICDNVIIGLNSGVVKNITESGTYIGTPSKRLNYENKNIL